MSCHIWLISWKGLYTQLWKQYYVPCMFFFKMFPHQWCNWLACSPRVWYIYRGFTPDSIKLVFCSSRPPTHIIKSPCKVRKRKDLLARNRVNVSGWSDMSIHWLLFQSASIIKIQLSVLVKYKADIIIISLNMIQEKYEIPKG